MQSSRRLEREAGRNVEVMWLLGRLAPDHKTIADFRKDNGLALRRVCARFVELCREMGLLATSGRGSGVVGYNVQVAVDTEHHLIVTHEVTNSGSDRAQLANMAKQARAVLETETLEAKAALPIAELPTRVIVAMSTSRVSRRQLATFQLYGRDAYEVSRIDSFLDVSLVFARVVTPRFRRR